LTAENHVYSSLTIRTLLVALVIVTAMPLAIHAQAPATPPSMVESLSPEAIDAIIAGAHVDAPATLTVANRTIVVLHASVLGRSAAGRVNAAGGALDDITGDGGEYRAESRQVRAAALISVNGRDVLAIVPADVDALLGETVESKAAAAVARLQQALDEIAEARRPGLLVRGLAQALAATVAFAFGIWLLHRARRRTTVAIEGVTKQTLSNSAVGGELVSQTRLLQWVRHSVDVIAVAIGLALAYVWLFFVLRRFPYTRPWGELLRSFLLDRLVWLAEGLTMAVPGLVTVAIIVAITRLAVRLVRILFAAVEEGRVALPKVYPETAMPTRKLITGLLWLLALVVAYPYLPGSGTDAFKGVSVFVGLLISLGSSGLVHQVMSGFSIVYSRALRTGDFVRVGEVLGTVTFMGTLATKIETPGREEITIPNALLVAQSVTNYSRYATQGVFIGTEVTIGYDVPWRQVEALLLLAASRTEGLRRDPAPKVWQTALEDFYVRYRLLLCLDDQRRRGAVMNALHANIQDAFNEHGVQIMSPNYEADPNAPKIVPKTEWFAAPAMLPRSMSDRGSEGGGK
jgi:small-conductance mechanosensitive channel